jgi:hypothetical protein
MHRGGGERDPTKPPDGLNRQRRREPIGETDDAETEAARDADGAEFVQRLRPEPRPEVEG